MIGQQTGDIWSAVLRYHITGNQIQKEVDHKTFVIETCLLCIYTLDDDDCGDAGDVCEVMIRLRQ